MTISSETTDQTRPITAPAAHAEDELRFAIMCNGFTFPAWQAECIRAIMDQGLAKPVGLILDGTVRDRPKRLMERLRSKRFAWNLFQRVAVNWRATATRPVDLSLELADVPVLRCSPTKRGGGQYFDQADVAAVRELRADFVLRFAFNIIRGEILTAARFGVWSFHHDDLDRYRGTPACFWPMHCGDSVQGVTLQRLTEGLDCGIVLDRCWLKCVQHDYAKNRDNAFMYASDLPARICRGIRAGQTAELTASPSATTAPVRTIPTAKQVVGFSVRAGAKALGNAVSSRVLDSHWAIGIIDRPIDSVLSGVLPEPRWLRPTRRGHFLADPFAARVDGKLVVLAEDYTSRSSRGHISAFQIDASGEVSEGSLAIMEPYHLSYPYLVERSGELFCIPESAAAECVPIYACDRRPLAPWRRAGTLLTGIRSLDTTILEFQGRWWMFCCTRRGTSHTRLEIFHSPDLFGPWKPHVRNPVKADIRSTRPAGKPFIREGALYRPAQDCSGSYGGAVVLNRVSILTPEDYAESPCLRIEAQPEWKFPDGLHTLSWTEDCILVDAKRRVVLPRAISKWFPLASHVPQGKNIRSSSPDRVQD
jgi:hypothetical protein